MFLLCTILIFISTPIKGRTLQVHPLEDANDYLSWLTEPGKCFSLTFSIRYLEFLIKTLTDVYEKRSQFVYAKKSHPTEAKKTAGRIR